MFTTIVNKYPSTRDFLVNGCWRWIEGKKNDDGVKENLWRVHDKLYDLNNFIDQHPGGKYWLEISKGTDITEAFESHHITSKASEMLNDFYVQDTCERRNYNFTFNQNGFYKTLQRKVAEQLKTIDHRASDNTKRLHDLVLFGLFVSLFFAYRVESTFALIIWILLSGQLLAWLVSLSHNFLHQADNWRMRTSNLAMINWRDWRVFHVLSHHMYPNSSADYEVSGFEPYLRWLPRQTRSWSYIILAFGIFFPLVVPLTFFYLMFKSRLFGYFWSEEKVFQWDDLLMLLLPAVPMILNCYELTQESFLQAETLWTYVILAGSFFYAIVFFNRGHHHPDLLHQSDEIASLDFGEYQVRTMMDRPAANKNLFTTSVYHGEQVLHHLFPTLDHAILPQLKGTLLQTCKQFNIHLHSGSLKEVTVGTFEQLLRTEMRKVGKPKQV